MKTIEKWDKYVYTAILCGNHMAFALTVTAIGPVLTEMVDILQTSTQWMTMFTTFTSIGFLLGSFFAFLVKYLNRQLILTVFLAIMAIALTFIPYTPNMYVLYTLAISIGLGAGILNCVINVWLIEMWQLKSAPVLQIPGLTFGLGTILAPVILKPFLRDKYIVYKNSTITNNGTAFLSSTYTSVTTVEEVTNIYNKDYEEWRRSLLKTPFYALGAIQMLFPILLLMMFIIKRYKYTAPEKSDTRVQNDDSNAEQEYKLFDRQRRHRVLAILLFSILIGTFNIYESMIYTFAVTYFQYSPLQLTATKAADVITAFTTSYTVFRGLSIFVAIKVRTYYMLSTHYTINVLGIICLVFARNNLTLLWVANVIIGIGCSAVMQTTFAFIGQHIRLNDTISTIMIVFMGSFNIAPPYLLGLVIKEFSAIFIVFEAVAIFVSILLFAILMFLIKKSKQIEQGKHFDATDL